MVLCVLHGAFPEAAMEAALHSHLQVHVPLAPPEGLLLANAGFWDDKRQEYRLALRREHVDACRAFKEQSLYPHIAALLSTPQPARRLRAGEAARSEMVFPAFFAQLGAYRFPEPAPDAQGWALLEAEHARWRELQAQARADYERNAAARAAARVEGQAAGGAGGAGGADGAGKEARAGGGGANGGRGVGKGGRNGRGFDIPQGLMTAVCVRHSLFPSPATVELRRLLLNALARGEIGAPPPGAGSTLETGAQPGRVAYEAFLAWLEGSAEAQALLARTPKFSTLPPGAA
jgi:hypothetical protein